LFSLHAEVTSAAEREDLRVLAPKRPLPAEGQSRRDPDRSAGMVSVSLGYGSKLGHVPAWAELAVCWGKSPRIVVPGQTLLSFIENDGK